MGRLETFTRLKSPLGYIAGATYYSYYFQEHYTVLSCNPDGTVTTQTHGDGRWSNPQPPAIHTHRTRLDAKDKMVAGWWDKARALAQVRVVA